ncbi:hypothetical protein DPMN_115873 [Dreissena polymorpha]|uniref:Uncharacterized protein n=1 Tax=Dreissena polymorpha TaxID=45954 RepID=A0A9D4KM05_DREPO|nr:hypothetical protein DPMN_115873 [Dreissena polymorpha]
MKLENYGIRGKFPLIDLKLIQNRLEMCVVVDGEKPVGSGVSQWTVLGQRSNTKFIPREYPSRQPGCITDMLH